MIFLMSRSHIIKLFPPCTFSHNSYLHIPHYTLVASLTVGSYVYQPPPANCWTVFVGKRSNDTNIFTMWGDGGVESTHPFKSGLLSILRWFSHKIQILALLTNLVLTQILIFGLSVLYTIF